MLFNPRASLIEDSCWLGERCMVLKGVMISARSIVAANAVVTREAPFGVVVAGVLAKVIKILNMAQGLTLSIYTTSESCK